MATSQVSILLITIYNTIRQNILRLIDISSKKKLKEGVVCMSYVPSEHQLVDIITKGLNNSMFHNLVFKLGMEDIYSLA